MPEEDGVEEKGLSEDEEFSTRSKGIVKEEICENLLCSSFVCLDFVREGHDHLFGGFQVGIEMGCVGSDDGSLGLLCTGAHGC